MAWPSFHPLKMEPRSTIRWQHRLKREHPTCTERINRSSKSADGRVATRREKRLAQRKNKRMHLTPTGPLREGRYAQNYCSSSMCNRDVSRVYAGCRNGVTLITMRIPRSATWPLMLLVLFSISPVLADDTVDAAVNRLSTVERFAFGGVGYAGVTSKGETDFKLVLAQPKPTALNAFERLYAIGNQQGKS
jgi:hypothetical protein